MQSSIRPSRVASSFAYIWVRTRRRVSMSLIEGPEFRRNISPTSSTDSIGLTKHAPVNGAAPAWGCPSPVGQSKLMVVRYPYPAKAETDVRFESVYPLRAVALAIQKRNDRVLDAQVAQSESELRTL